jgi:hypothetical protein
MRVDDDMTWRAMPGCPLGTVDARTIEKYEKEAKDKNRESWYMAGAYTRSRQSPT